MFVDFFFTAVLPKEVFAGRGGLSRRDAVSLDALDVGSIIAPEN
ncbi:MULTISPECIES: hypothetical protein [unclassified Caballeronia]|jgi:hypothetical protein|nr:MULTISPECIES: hypothetical protein [unclassified Caballeronia]